MEKISKRSNIIKELDKWVKVLNWNGRSFLTIKIWKFVIQINISLVE